MVKIWERWSYEKKEKIKVKQEKTKLIVGLL